MIPTDRGIESECVINSYYVQGCSLIIKVHSKKCYIATFDQILKRERKEL
jgi:hypothetical protein